MIVGLAGFAGGGSMPEMMVNDRGSMHSRAPTGIPDMSDDECLVRLAQVVAEPDLDHLDEVALLIGRLAVAIE
jgi:hypothetical protein